MEKIFSPSIDSILSEASLDDRIDDGIVNLKNSEHVLVVVEKMYYAGASLELLEEFVKKHIATEGKFPERQAYNKEGWLVTFPSSDYKNAAIKKGSHFASDPTHGKGGMNVYYKRKGKQKRMTAQEPTRNEPTNQLQQKVNPTKVGEPSQTPVSPVGKVPTEEPNTTPDGQPSSPKDSTAQSPTADTKTGGPDTEKSSGGDSALSPSDAAGGKRTNQNQSSPAADAPSVPTAPAVPSYVNISVEFAKNKQWNPTPYGEWRNISGDTVAVVSLSGEVVPIKTTDREELKLFVAKKQP